MAEDEIGRLNRPWARLLSIVVVLALVAFSALAYGRTQAGGEKAVRGFLWFEREWKLHWPLRRGKEAVRRLRPLMQIAGLFRPMRMEVEPGIILLLDPGDYVQGTVLASGEWEPEVWQAVSSGLHEGGVFLDVGAHIGYYSLKSARKVGPGGRVISFEPNPETLQVLRENVTASRVFNVTIEPIACTDREQALTLYAGPRQNTGSSSLSPVTASMGSGSPPRAFSVRGRPIDDVIRELGLRRVDVVKIDVEGAELLVLRGARETLKRFRPRVVVEVTSSLLANLQAKPEDLASFLLAMGYTKSRQIDAANWEWSVE